MEILMFIMIIMIILNVIFIRAILYCFSTINEMIHHDIKGIEDKNKKEVKRNHAPISQSNFSSILNGRTNVYAKYKNEDGLYEPVQGKRGVNLNKKDKGE